MEAFARALRQLPTIIADNGGFDGSELITSLRAAHAEGVKVSLSQLMKSDSILPTRRLFFSRSQTFVSFLQQWVNDSQAKQKTDLCTCSLDFLRSSPPPPPLTHTH